MDNKITQAKQESHSSDLWR